jgi:hypothetical protein
MIVSKNNWFQRGLGMKALPLILIIAFFAYRGAALAQSDKAAVLTARQDVIWDLFAAPANEDLRRIAIFRDTHFGAGSACVLNLPSASSEKPVLSRLESTADVKREWQTSRWFLVNWHWRNSTEAVFQQDLPSLCSNSARVTTANQTIDISSSYDNAVADEISIGPNDVLLKVDSRLYFRKMFGRTLFPKNDTVPWPILYLQHRFTMRRLMNYQSLTLTFTAKLVEANFDAHVLTTTGPTPDNASRIYNPGVNATRMLISLPLRWHPKYCSGEVLKSDDNCRTYFNKPLNVLTYFYDDRWEYWDKEPINIDPGTAGFGNIYLYRQGCQDLIENHPQQNPFKIVGKLATANGDILPSLKNAILYARRFADSRGMANMPPRLKVGDRTETDDEYLSNFMIADFGIGYENSGLASIAYDIKALSLKGVLRE